MKMIFPELKFSWKKLFLIGFLNIGLSSLTLYFYKNTFSTLWLVLLCIISITTSITYILLIDSMTNKTKPLKRFTYLFLALTPFLSLPIALYLWSKKNNTLTSTLTRTKLSLLLVGSFFAFFVSLRPTEFISKKHILFSRLLPPEISFLILSHAEAKNVSALTPFDLICMPKSAKKILELRKSFMPTFSELGGLNPTALFKVLPLGMSWIRGAPAHSVALLQFHLMAVDKEDTSKVSE